MFETIYQGPSYNSFIDQMMTNGAKNLPYFTNLTNVNQVRLSVHFMNFNTTH